MSHIHDDKYYMAKALNQARKAYDANDIPVGAVIVYNENNKNKNMCEAAKKASIEDGEILAASYNMRSIKKNAICHAEILAISKACKKIKDFRLEECTLYVTLEPCQMCAGAIVQSRIKRLVYGAKSKKSGSCGSIIDILENEKFNHRVIVDYMDDNDCKSIMKDFFKEIRKVD